MIHKILIALLVALAIAPVPISADPGANQLVSWSALCTGITEGSLTAVSGTPSQCSSTPNRIVTWANVTAAINSSGCATGNPLPTWSQILNCRTSAVATAETQSITFSGAFTLVNLMHTGGASGTIVANGCGTTTAAVTKFTMPSTTLAPTSSTTQLSWTPSGSGNAYTISFVNPSGSTAMSNNVAASSTNKVSFSASGAPAGAWSIVESGLSSQTCSGSGTSATESGSQGEGPGTAGWFV
jgi:hypothetical protein